MKQESKLRHYFPTRAEIAMDKWRILGVVVSGTLLRFAFPRFDIWCVAWIAPSIFFYSLLNLSVKRAFWIGWLFGFCFYYCTISWLNTLTAFNSFVPIGIFLLGIAMGLFVAVFAVVNGLFEKKMPRFRLFYTPALWSIFEFARSLGPFGFAWAYLGHTHYTVLPFIQISALTGVYGVSFIIATANVAIALLILHFSAKKKAFEHSSPPVLGMVIALVLIALNIFYGTQAMKKTYSNGAPVTIGIVQPNVPQEVKMESYASPDAKIREKLQLRLLQELAELVISLKGKAELIVCPETAVSDPFFSINEPLKEFMVKLAREANTPILFGSDYTVLSEDEQSLEEIYNSTWLVEPDSGLSKKIYHKINLVPFGEYVPFSTVIPFLQESIVQIGNFDAGRESVVFTLKDNAEFGVLICFESSSSRLARQLVKNGAEFLAVLTNDAWYGDSSGAYQHFALSIFRAIEFRRPVVRSANTGISAFISPTGKIMKSLPLGMQGTIRAEIQPSRAETFYARYSDIFILILFLLLIMMTLGRYTIFR